jgi:serine phosphatase RsbU (regulator of sigma subunit)
VLIEHRDRARAVAAAAAMARRPDAVTEDTPSRRIAAGGRAMLIPEVTEELLRSTTRDEETRVLLRRMGAASAIVVPLLGSRGVLGSIAVFRGPGEPAYTGAELDVATEVGRRPGAAVAVVVANRRQRALAEELQRSMLTEPPVLPDVEIEARYVPAADEAQVGGDWYDSFVRRDGSVLLTVGDVVGHDFEAAAVMGQLRGVLRGIGFGQVGGPAEVLGGLDSAMDALYPGVTATAVVGTLTRRGPDSVLRWSSAGHPPPVVIRADGTADATDLDSADLLLGVVPGVERREHEVVLRGGDTVLFFSDGLIERRGSDLDEGLVRLVGSTRELVGLHLAVLSDQVLLRQMGAEQEDDICLIAVRVHDCAGARLVGSSPCVRGGARPCTGRGAWIRPTPVL